MRKTFVSLKPGTRVYSVCIRMLVVGVRTLVVCQSYVSRMYPYVPECSVCYSYVTGMLLVALVGCFSHDPNCEARNHVESSKRILLFSTEHIPKNATKMFGISINSRGPGIADHKKSNSAVYILLISECKNY